MGKLLALAIFLLAAVGPFSASASTSASDDKAETADLLYMFDVYCGILVREGVSQIDGIAIETINKKAHAVNLTVTDEISVAAENSETGARRSAYWDPQTETLFLSRLHLQNVGDIAKLKGLFIHEMFRAVGVADDNYNTSAVIESFMRLKSDHIDRALTRQIPSLPEPSNFEVLRNRILKGGLHGARGGISGVGGGGDVRALVLKREVIGELFRRYDAGKLSEKVFISCMDTLEKLQIEVSPQVRSGTMKQERGGWLLLISTDTDISLGESQGLQHLAAAIANHVQTLAARP